MTTIICPTCKGEQSVSVEIVEYGVATPAKPVVMNCVVCNGVGRITPRMLKQLQKQNNMWCKCAEPGEPQYHEDNPRSRTCKKHHWTCGNCGKITQIG